MTGWVRPAISLTCLALSGFLSGLLTFLTPPAKAESRITAVKPEPGTQRGTAVSARLRFVVEVPARLELNNTSGAAMVTTNSGTLVGQCDGATTAKKNPECTGTGFGTSGANNWQVPRTVTTVTQP